MSLALTCIGSRRYRYFSQRRPPPHGLLFILASSHHQLADLRVQL
jgi:hypothetical protein